MIRLLLLLLGTRYVRSWWRVHAAAGYLLALTGALLFIDAIDGVLYFPLRIFGAVLLVEAGIMLVTSLATSGMRRRLLFGRGVIVAITAVLVVIGGSTADFLNSMIFGFALALGGALRIAAAWVVRFDGYRRSLVAGVIELAVAAVVLDPHWITYGETVPFITGLAMFLVGVGLVRLAWRLRDLPPGELLETLFSRGWHRVDDEPDAQWSRDGSLGTLVVHVWTAEGTAVDPVMRPVINRYIAAVDRTGVVSTGHSAVEYSPHLYASHYPAVEIDHSPGDFTSLLRATPDNNVPGLFQPGYAQEAAGWCESTWKVTFPDFNASRLRAWWASYSRDATYNLTNRSCSTTAAYVLETALEGVVGQRSPTVVDVMKLGFSPELWLAGQFRAQAENMAWTPGLFLDYSRALRGSLEPPPLPSEALVRIVIQALRRRR